MSVKNSYKGIDIIKFVCAILVIAIHTEPGSFNIWADRTIGILTRTAVPFFFVATGFFFSINNRCDIKKYVVRILLLLLVNVIVYIPFVIKDIAFVLNNSSDFYELVIKLFELLFVGKTVPHLWYLPASIVAVTLFYILNKKLSRKTVLFISLVFFAIGTFASTYRSIIENISIFRYLLLIVDRIGTRNGLFYGFFFVTLGSYIEENRPKKNFIYFLVLSMISLLVLALEALFATKLFDIDSTIMWFSQILCAYSLFNFALLFQPNIENTKNIRNISTLMYNFHYVFVLLLDIYYESCGVLAFSIVLILTLLLSVIVSKLSEKYRIFRIFI